MSMVWRPMDGEGVEMWVEPHVEMLAREWQPATSRGPTTAEPRRHARRHHHFHLRLHAAH